MADCSQVCCQELKERLGNSLLDNMLTMFESRIKELQDAKGKRKSKRLPESLRGKAQQLYIRICELAGGDRLGVCPWLLRVYFGDLFGLMDSASSQVGRDRRYDVC